MTLRCYARMALAVGAPFNSSCSSRGSFGSVALRSTPLTKSAAGEASLLVGVEFETQLAAALAKRFERARHALQHIVSALET